ncbi:MAG: hypothetical protein M3068_14695 [Gemmatimonadota bacterium]|nr:hypothetical protein [Gemmatimonadota bacterium]
MDRHLLPEELDQLLDGESGFGTTPLKAHVRRCDHCRAELNEARILVEALEHLPHFTPPPFFAHRVMAQVQIYVPWHVSLLASTRAWLPRSRPARAAAGLAVGSAAAVLTIASLWLIARYDTVMFAVGLAIDRSRGALVDALSSMIASLFGSAVLEAVRASGVIGFAVLATVLLLTAAGATRALRALAVGSSGDR